jgi:hypothetical protein
MSAPDLRTLPHLPNARQASVAYSMAPGLRPHYPRARTASGPSIAGTTRSRTHRSESPASAQTPDPPDSTFPEIENFDPTYGLRPEGLPNKSVFRSFGRLRESQSWARRSRRGEHRRGRRCSWQRGRILRHGRLGRHRPRTFSGGVRTRRSPSRIEFRFRVRNGAGRRGRNRDPPARFPRAFPGPVQSPPPFKSPFVDLPPHARRARTITPRRPTTPPSFAIQLILPTFRGRRRPPTSAQHARILPTSTTHQKRQHHRYTIPRLGALYRPQVYTHTNQVRTRTPTPYQHRPQQTSCPLRTRPRTDSRGARLSRARARA